jgi:hypothetical protein
MTGFASKRKMGLSRMSDEVLQSPPREDYGLSRARDWKLKLCWLPKKCFLTEKPLWGKRAYHGVRGISGPGEPVLVDYWIDKYEFVKWQLTKE